VHGHHGFTIRSHVLEIFGLCENCQSAGKNPQALASLS
jgi:Fe2+ or Zn2+ uptake regulation protein